MNKKPSCTILILILTVCIFSCDQSKNDKNAFVYNDGKKWIIKLIGKRVPLVHDIFSVFTEKRYKDSLLIPIPKYKTGVNCLINGSEIEVPEGYYKYQGFIILTGKILTVNLLINNTHDKTLVPEIWNGEYNVIFK